MYIQLNSQVLYYEKSGEGAPLILLHGNSEDHTIFEELLPHLEPHFTVYAPDTRGHGLSSPSNEYHYRDMAEDMKNLIEALSLERPSVLGFSDGAIIALMMGILCGDKLNKLICCGANLTPDGLDWKTRHQIKKHYRKTKDPLYKLMLDEPNLTSAHLAKITNPTLVIAGQKDMVKEAQTKQLASSLPNSALRIIPGATHDSYIVHSDAIAGDIIDFLG